MEPPAKRPRLALQSHSAQDNDEDDELNFEPEEVSRRRDPGYILQQERAVAADRLKSTFEHIFEKYERDFSEIGDEIDLRTGEIIVNRGHLEAMRNEKDVGDEPEDEEDEGMLLSELLESDSEEDPDGAADTVDEDEEDRILQGRALQQEPTSQALQVVSRPGASSAQQPPLPTPVRLASQHRLSHLAHSRYTPMKSSPLSRGAWELENDLVDPAWRTPELPRQLLPGSSPARHVPTIYQLPAMDGSQSVWASESGSMQWPSPRRGLTSSVRQRARLLRPADSSAHKLLPAPSSDDDDEDEILMGSSQKTTANPPKSSSPPPSSPTPAPNSVSTQSESGPRSSTSKLKAKRTEKHLPSQPPVSKATEGKPTDTSRASSPAHEESQARSNLESNPQPIKRPRGRPRKIRPADTVKFSTPAAENTDSEVAAALPSKTPEQPSTRQQFEIAIPFRRAPTPGSLTIVDDTSPQSARHVDGLPTPPLQDSDENDTLVNIASDAVGEEVDDSMGTTNPAPPEGEAAPLAESFTRNEIDPSYEFSDEDDVPARKAPSASSKPVQGTGNKPDKVTAQVRSAHHRSTGMMAPPKRRKSTATRKRKRVDSPTSDISPLDSATEAELEEANHPFTAPENTASHPNVEMIEYEVDMVVAPQDDGLASNDIGETSDLSHPTQPEARASQSVQRDQTKTTPRRTTRQAVPLSLTKKRIVPSPVHSDDSLGVALDAIIASEKLFEDNELDSSPHFAMPKSPSKQASAPSPSRRRSVRFLDEDVLEGTAKSKIISTPPLRQATARREDVPKEQDDAEMEQPKEDLAGFSDDDIMELDSSPRRVGVKKSPVIKMFSAAKARRGKRASLPSSQDTPKPPPKKTTRKATPKPSRKASPVSTKKKTKETKVNKPVVKRRSILSLGLKDSDEDEDPLNAMSLVTFWTPPPANGKKKADSRSTPEEANPSTAGTRTAREGSGGLTTPAKKNDGSMFSSPSGAPLIETPRGLRRRCGIDGFVCDRAFCFKCMCG